MKSYSGCDFPAMCGLRPAASRGLHSYLQRTLVTGVHASQHRTHPNVQAHRQLNLHTIRRPAASGFSQLRQQRGRRSGTLLSGQLLVSSSLTSSLPQIGTRTVAQLLVRVLDSRRSIICLIETIHPCARCLTSYMRLPTMCQ